MINEQRIKEEFNKMSDVEKRQFLDDVNRYHLAVSVTTDPELIESHVLGLFEKYPFLENC